MNEVKEWLSDYLRYFILLLALLLALGAIFLGVKLYQSTQTVQGDPDSVTILNGTEHETSADTETKTETETETKTETEAVTETKTESETDLETDAESKTEADNEANTQPNTEQAVKTESEQKNAGEKETVRQETEAATKNTEKTETISTERTASETAITIHTPETQRQTETRQTEQRQTETRQTEQRQTNPATPVSMTMTETCYIRSYADYGDNIIGEYPAGTTVEFLEDVDGWAKVRVDGRVGYMGTRFLTTEPVQIAPPQTEPPQTEPPKPVYMTMTGTCYIRSYADYGDNIIGEYPAGTVVEFLEDVGGWYKVQIDGMVGYMGARFFQ